MNISKYRDYEQSFDTHKLNTASLNTARLTSRSVWILLVPVLFGDLAVISGVGEDDTSDSPGVLSRFRPGQPSTFRTRGDKAHLSP